MTESFAKSYMLPCHFGKYFPC